MGCGISQERTRNVPLDTNLNFVVDLEFKLHLIYVVAFH